MVQGRNQTASPVYCSIGKRDGGAMSISVIIPTLNGGLFLPSLVTELRNQTTPPVEIIVIDSGPENGTKAVAEGLGCKFIGPVPRFDQWRHPQRGRSRGKRRYPWSLFLRTPCQLQAKPLQD